nr:toxin C-terminal domain-containing protein [Clostridium gasigenes]
MGFERTNYKSHGKPVYKKGRRYITPDVDSHNGGTWKMADSVKDLGSKRTRTGTYDFKLDRIGD